MSGLKDIDLVVAQYRTHVLAAWKHFNYSYNKVRILPTDPTQLDEETMETWESFSSRFARLTDIFLTKYVRACVLRNDPGFVGTIADFVNQGEKLGLLEDGRGWMQLRALRNIEAHTYNEDLARFLTKLRDSAPQLLTIQELIKRANNP